MIIFLTLCYCAILFVLVRSGFIRLNTFWKASPLLWMLLLLIVLIIPMQWGAPSGPVRTYNPVIEILPNVTGEVVDVPVGQSTRVTRGDVLFKIDPVPFQAVVDQKRAALAEARQAVPQLKANLDATLAAVAEAEANRDLAKDDYNRYRIANENAVKRGSATKPFSEADVEQRRLIYLSSEAVVARSQAVAEQARLAYGSEIDGINTNVARLEADLRKAQYDLEQTTVRAPDDGYVLGLTLRPGQRVGSLPFRSWMAFVPNIDRRVIVAIPQTRLRFVKAGQPVEITFSFKPGQIFKATVEEVVSINASGQLPPSGVLPSLNALYGQPNEMMGVAVQIDHPDIDVASLPGGADGEAAIYTQSAQFTHLVRRIMIRMDAWLNYLRPI